MLIYDDLRADNEQTMRRILRFLDVDDSVPIAAAETETLKSVRFPLLHRFATAMRVAERNPTVSGRTARAVNALIPSGARSASVRGRWRRLVYGASPATDEQLMLELRRRFKPEVERFSDYLGRDLVSLWGYDSLG